MGRIITVLLLLATLATAADPYFVDLRQAANAGLEDDGTAGNGKGGWSDEGINDFFIYPAVTFGKIERYGYQFTLIDPSTNDGRSVIMLRGANGPKDRPAAVTIPVGEVKGKYLYFMQNSHSRPAKIEANAVVAVYTIAYADGSTATLDLHDGVELRHWWMGKWWDNSEAKSWPIFRGTNSYSRKWRMYVAVWAMQWPNPHPERAIKSLTLTSKEQVVPVVWGITIADEDFFEPKERRQEAMKAPPAPPAGYFDKKEAIERERVFAVGAEAGHFQGVRRIELLRPDLLAITVDGALGHIGPGAGTGTIEKLQRPEIFAVSSPTDKAFSPALAPQQVGRSSYEMWVGNLGPFPHITLYWHTFYLQLPRPLTSGNRYEIKVAEIAGPYQATASLNYDEQRTPSPAVKINQVAYSSRASRRYAYLGYWAGDLGKVDYGAYDQFRVLNDADNQVVASGRIMLRKADDPKSGEDVYELDLSGVKTPGRYRIQIPGLGCSDPFAIGTAVMKELHYHTMRAFFHQRCGQEFKEPWTTFVKPACHREVWEGGYLVGNPSYVPKPGEAKQEFRGGYHDAADFDTFSYHLRATDQALVAYEAAPEKFRDRDLNLPESGNGIPDLLDEANWGLSFYRDFQQADGGIPLGRGNDCDAIRDWERQHKSRPPFGVFPPTQNSNLEFAAVAAHFARLVKPFDAKLSQGYLDAAQRAYAVERGRPDPFAEADAAELKLEAKAREQAARKRQAAQRERQGFLARAAVELFSATGAAEYHDDFKNFHQEGALSNEWPYLICTRPEVDKGLQQTLRKWLLSNADNLVKYTEMSAYRMGDGGRSTIGWGTGNGGGHYADLCLRAYWLTKEQKYLDTACLNADFQLGANPISMCLISGLGARHAFQPQISAFLFSGPNTTGETVKGISHYGLASRVTLPWYPQTYPEWRRFRCIDGGAEVCSEFTIHETIGPAAMLYATLYALEP